MKQASVKWLYWMNLSTSGGYKTQGIKQFAWVINKSGMLCQEARKKIVWKQDFSNLMSQFNVNLAN